MSYSVYVFGEDDTDRRAICNLIRAINNELPRPATPIKTSAIRNPLILSEGATRRKRDIQSEEIAAILSIEARRNIRAIAVVHTDCDAIEPAHQHFGERLRTELTVAGARYVVAAVPAWEIEAWWMLFPEALAATRSCWRQVEYSGQQVGRIIDPKKKLTRDLRAPASRRGRCRDYDTQDSITISKHIEDKRLLRDRRGRAGDSFNHFVEQVREVLS